MNIQQVQIIGAINSAVNDIVIRSRDTKYDGYAPGQRDLESDSSNNNQENKREELNGLNTKVSMKDSWSAFELRDTEDLGPYRFITSSV